MTSALEQQPQASRRGPWQVVATPGPAGNRPDERDPREQRQPDLLVAVGDRFLVPRK